MTPIEHDDEPGRRTVRIPGSRDHGGIRHVAHTLKSSSASIGALQLSQHCADIEAMIRLEKVDDLDSRVDALCAEVEIVLQALRALLDGEKK